jgi:flap endonuclease-1
MGVKIYELLNAKPITLDDLNGKRVAVDAYLTLYQFITTIRQLDGTPLMDSKGNTTSHLSGLFSRTTNLLQKNIKLIYVFDGIPPKLKEKERERRIGIKAQAQIRYDAAKKEEDIEEMKKYAARTSRLTKEIIEESKQLLKAMGIPIVQAPSEGEAQAAYMVSKGDAYALATQDADGFLFGTPRLIKNLNMVGKRKKSAKLAYETIQPEIIELNEALTQLGIDQNQLIALGMLVGTDYNIGGIKGIGPKNALKLVKQYGNDFDSLFRKCEWNKYFDYDWQEVYELFRKIPTTDDYHLKWNNVDNDLIKDILVNQHDFSQERVESTLAKIKTEQRCQKGLGDFF